MSPKMFVSPKKGSGKNCIEKDYFHEHPLPITRTHARRHEDQRREQPLFNWKEEDVKLESLMLSSPPATIDTLPPFPCEEQDSKVQDLIVRESDEENSAWTAPQVLRFGRDADEQLVITGDVLWRCTACDVDKETSH